MSLVTGSVTVPTSSTTAVYQTSSSIPVTVTLQGDSNYALLSDGNPAHAAVKVTYPLTLTNFSGQISIQNQSASALTVTYYAYSAQ